MNAYELALQLQVESSQAEYGYVVDDWKLLDDSAKMLRQQADRIAELSKNVDELEEELLKTTQIKELSDEELNKAFDYYCETDEGVLRFNYELRDDWKKEQLIRWKKAFKKASEK
jgi:hypothetical protein